ncbi:MAG: tetratricopeptide repeat protein [Chthoniobacterales bacterium]
MRFKPTACLFFFLLLSFAQAQQTPKASAPTCVMNAKDSTFAMLALNKKMPVLIYFTDVTQEQCLQMEPIIEQVAMEYASEVRFVRVDVARCPRIIKASNVKEVPYFCLMNRPAHLTFNFTGVLDKDNLRKLIERGINPQSILEGATAKYNDSDFKGAIEDYTLALKINAKEATIYHARGNAKYALHDNKGAIADYTQAIQIAPDNPEFYKSRALARSNKDDLDGSVADYSQALKFLPAEAALWNGRGVPKSRMGNYEEAIKDFSQALKCDPKLVVAYRNRGMAKLAKGDNSGAASDFRQALTLKESLDGALDLWVAQSREGQRVVASRDLITFFDQHKNEHSFSDEGARAVWDFFLDKMSADNLIDRLGTVEPAWAKNMIACTIYYYIGQEKLASKKQPEAAEYFRRAVSTGETALLTYTGAMAELAESRTAQLSPLAPTKAAAPEIVSPVDPAHNAQKEASDFFRLGEMVELSCLQSFFVANGTKRDRHFENLDTLSRELGAPQSVQDDITRIRKINTHLPSSLAFSNWLNEEKALVATAAPDPAVWNQWLADSQDKQLYFWLGRLSLRAWMEIQKNIADRRSTPIQELKSMQSVVKGANTILTQKRYESALQRLNNETFAALTEIDSLKAVIDESISAPPSLSVVNALGNAGIKLFALNKEQKLLKTR